MCSNMLMYIQGCGRGTAVDGRPRSGHRAVCTARFPTLRKKLAQRTADRNRTRNSDRHETCKRNSFVGGTGSSGQAEAHSCPPAGRLAAAGCSHLMVRHNWDSMGSIAVQAPLFKARAAAHLSPETATNAGHGQVFAPGLRQSGEILGSTRRRISPFRRHICGDQIVTSCPCTAGHLTRSPCGYRLRVASVPGHALCHRSASSLFWQAHIRRPSCRKLPVHGWGPNVKPLLAWSAPRPLTHR